MKTTGDTRTWTDDQLRQAVADSKSWRAVARTLGLKGTSAGTIRSLQRHAARLDLKTSHFTGQRQWFDPQLRAVILKATCWADVLAGLGVADIPQNRMRMKGHAVRLGLDCTHLRTTDLPPSARDVLSEPAQPEMLRTAAPAVAMAWFTMRGCAVALPVEPQVYDLLVTTTKGIQRVQVKS